MKSHWSARRSMRFAVWLGLLALIASVPARSQGRWDFDPVTTVDLWQYNPQVQIDRWGNTHVMFSTRDPQRSGLQLFYTSNSSGRFAAPIQVTDTGTVLDSSHADFSSFVFRLDSNGAAHVAFIANVENHLRLYYTDNVDGHFADARFLAEQTRYGMAVDSTGQAHVVWTEEGTNIINVHYWSNRAPEMSRLISSLQCNIYSFGCRVGDIEVEAGARGVFAGICSDSSSINLVSLPFGVAQRVAVPGYDRWETMQGRADLRFRMALDAEGAVHLLLPRIVSGRYRLVYANNASSYFVTTTVVDSLRVSPAGFDLDFNGTNRMVAVWSVEENGMPGVTGFAELVRPTKVWALQPIVRDLDKRLFTGGEIPKRGLRIAARGDQVVIVAKARPQIDREEIVGVITRAGLKPAVAYLHPDAAAAGMNVVVESIAPVRERGSFGVDGFRGDTVRLQLMRPTDSNRVIVGPSVVSWDGRLVSTMLFVRPGASSGPVPVALRVGNATSNVDTFFIVEPQHLGDSAGVLAGGGALGSGGRFGVRSRRGVLVVDSLHLRDGIFSVDTIDTDPSLPGNQGFLPVTILSAGPVRIESDAVLTVSAQRDAATGGFSTAGPGGGGGGSGGWRIGGGSGFAGGAGPGRYTDGPIGASLGTGPGERSSRWGGGSSLNGVPGGLVFPAVPGGGGSGHPFGSSGSFGRASLREPDRADSGAYGGATAGSMGLFFDGPTSGGGGGGHATRGESGNDINEVLNGGAAVGSRPLVPIAGGSGGGGGGFATNGVASGGGGGGALAIYAYDAMVIAGSIRADGGNGRGDVQTTNSSGGGGGAGGGVVIGAKGGVRFEAAAMISARGGAGGNGDPVGARSGGRGSDGRIRIDGRAVGSIATRTTPRAAYTGPATLPNGSIVSRTGDTLRGTGEPGRTIRLFMRGELGVWRFNSPIDVVVGADSTWKLKLGPDAASGRLYIAAMQKLDNPRRGGANAEPAWVMSPAGGNIIGQPSMSLSASGHSFPCIKYGETDTATIFVRNTGSLADLEIRSVTISGGGGAAFDREYAGERIAPGESMPLLLRFNPQDTGLYRATVTIVTNAMPEGTSTLALEGCAVAGELRVSVDTIDLGTVCLGDTVVRTLTLENIGDVPLVVDRIRGYDDVLDAMVIGEPEKFTLDPGSSKTIRIAFVVRSFDSNEMRLRIETDGTPSRVELVVLARDGRPMPGLDRATLQFRTLNVSVGDTCDTRTLTVRNESADDTLTITSAALWPSAPFSLLTPLAGRTIAPRDSIVVTLGLCSANPGDFSANLFLRFVHGSCETTDSTALHGRATQGAIAFTVIEPADLKWQFKQTLVGAEADPKVIVVENTGDIAARLAAPELVLLDAQAGEFTLLNAASRELLPGETIEFELHFAPASVGAKTAEVRLATEDGLAWTSTISVGGDGILPGVAFNFSELTYGDVRLGDTAVRTLEIFNTSALDTIRSATIAADGRFELVSIDRPLPAAIGIGDTIRALVAYHPTTETVDASSVTIDVASRPAATIGLSGRGVLEHPVAIEPVVDFGVNRRYADVSRPNAFRIYNRGTHELVITGYDFEQDDSLFAWDGVEPTFPITIDTNRSISFSLHYRAAKADTAAIVFTTSAPAPEDEVRVRLLARIEKEADTVDLRIGVHSGYVGNERSIPVEAEFSALTEYDQDYSVTVSFEPGLLAPRGAVAGTRLPAAVLAGTMSSEARWDMVSPGQVRITGTVRGGSQKGKLFNIPMTVLTGPPAQSALAIESASFEVMPLYIIRNAAGVFIGIDCDTGRGIVVKGHYGLAQSTPNPSQPFGAPIIIDFSIADREHVRINLYDPSGMFVRALVDEVREPGSYRLAIDASTIGSGIYTYEMLSGPFRAVRRMVVVE